MIHRTRKVCTRESTTHSYRGAGDSSYNIPPELYAIKGFLFAPQIRK
ncbi:MAG: hypothetical protein ACTSX9_00105 [Candidatus Njordarchaeales archaeon]